MAKKRPQQRQPKQPSKRAQREAAAAKATFADDDESISSASEDDELQQPPVTEEREETVEEARLRRARAYVAEQRAAASDSDDDDLNERLREQREARSQRAFTRIDLDDFDGEACARRAVVLKGHRGPVTSVCLCEARNWCFSGSKDNGLLQHDMVERFLLHYFACSALPCCALLGLVLHCIGLLALLFFMLHCFACFTLPYSA